MRFGSFTVTQPIVRNAVGASLLGQSILKDFAVTLDQQRGRVQFVLPDGTSQDEPIPSASLYAAGWVVLPKADRVLVQEVFTGAAAESAGFRRDDVLLAIDGVLMGDLGCARHVSINDRPSRKSYLIERDGKRLEIEMSIGALVR